MTFSAVAGRRAPAIPLLHTSRPSLSARTEIQGTEAGRDENFRFHAPPDSLVGVDAVMKSPHWLSTIHGAQDHDEKKKHPQADEQDRCGHLHGGGWPLFPT